MRVLGLALTGNVLLVEGPGIVVAWLLTEMGTVSGVSGNRRANKSNSIWTVPIPLLEFHHITFSAKTQTGAINSKKGPLHIYHSRTGQVLGNLLQPMDHQHCHVNMHEASSYHHHPFVDKDHIPHKDDWQTSQATLQEGWVKDPEGRHQLWLPVEWRVSLQDESWCPSTTTLCFKLPGDKVITIKF